MSVYFIADQYDRVKIGHAEDPCARLSAIQCGSPEQLYLMRAVQGGQKVEKWFHKKFAAHRLHGEWFRFDPAMLTLPAPDEIPAANEKQEPQPGRTIGEYLRDADRLGLLTPRMRSEYVALLGGQVG